MQRHPKPCQGNKKEDYKYIDIRYLDRVKKDIVKNGNLSQPNMVHKAVKCHIMKNYAIKIMEKELNIAAILKDKPKDIKLYLTTHGDCTLHHINNVDDSICVNRIFDGLYTEVSQSGKLSPNGEVVLFPSKEMRDWSKFAWKKGDVLTDKDRFVIFECFDDDEYTSFSAPFEYKDNAFRRDLGLIVDKFSKVSDNIAQEIIKRIEEHYGGKLNLSTLKIEKPLFKDGDIVVLEQTKDHTYIKCILILKAICKNKNEYSFYAIYNTFNNLVFFNNKLIHKGTMYPATDSEKQQLFDAIAKENKAWDADKKQIVDLPKKCEFKVFQKVLVRDYDKDEWVPGFFFKKHRDGERYVLVCGEIYKQCIPYNDQTNHLLGTTNDWEGGEE